MIDLSDRVRAAGLRVTRQRVAVLDAVLRQPHASAASVLARVGAVLPGVSHQAVYDCLAHLTAAGLLRRFAVPGGAALYEAETHDRHQHVVCRRCGAVADIEAAPDLAGAEGAAAAAGFVIDAVEITWRGRCAACAALHIQQETSHG